MTCPYCGMLNPASAMTCTSCGIAIGGLASGLGSGNATVHNALPPNTRLKNGAYTIDGVLGQGGFGITYSGRDSSGRQIAIKECYPIASTTLSRQGTRVIPMVNAELTAQVQKFVNEATTLASFSPPHAPYPHPNIVQVYDCFAENDTAYMVMEFLDGQTLEEVLIDQGAPIDEARAVDYIREVLVALEACHSLSLLHRDISPDNIRLTSTGRIVLLDFGSARYFIANRTMAFTVQLKGGFAPLEQYTRSGARFGPYSDFYSLGATLYRLITNQFPQDACDIVTGVLLLVSPRDINPRISPHINDAVLYAMQMATANRPQTALEFRDALNGILPARIQALLHPSTPNVGTPGGGPGGVGNRVKGWAGAGLVPLQFASGPAYSASDLARLCDLFPGEAAQKLYSNEFGPWLTSINQPHLAAHANREMGQNSQTPHRGLELFVRSLWHDMNQPSLPTLAPLPAQMTLGKLSVNAQTKVGTRLNTSGRGLAWGTVSVEPPIRGIQFQPQFEGIADIEISLDSSKLPAGNHTVDIVVRPEGMPETRIPLQFEVEKRKTALPVKFFWGAIALGGLFLLFAVLGGLPQVPPVDPSTPTPVPTLDYDKSNTTDTPEPLPTDTPTTVPTTGPIMPISMEKEYPELWHRELTEDEIADLSTTEEVTRRVNEILANYGFNFKQFSKGIFKKQGLIERMQGRVDPEFTDPVQLEERLTGSDAQKEIVLANFNALNERHKELQRLININATATAAVTPTPIPIILPVPSDVSGVWEGSLDGSTAQMKVTQSNDTFEGSIQVYGGQTFDISGELVSGQSAPDGNLMLTEIRSSENGGQSWDFDKYEKPSYILGNTVATIMQLSFSSDSKNHEWVFYRTQRSADNMLLDDIPQKGLTSSMSRQWTGSYGNSVAKIDITGFGDSGFTGTMTVGASTQLNPQSRYIIAIEGYWIFGPSYSCGGLWFKEKYVIEQPKNGRWKVGQNRGTFSFDGRHCYGIGRDTRNQIAIWEFNL